MADEHKQALEIMAQIRTRVAEYAHNLIRGAERCGNTPTEEGLNNILSQYFNEILATQAYPLTEVEKNMIRNDINNFNKTSIIPVYRASLKSKKREVNGQLPTTVTDEWLTDTDKKLQDVRKQITDKMTQLMADSIRTGKTPNKEMVSVYLQTQMNRAILDLGNIDVQTQEYIRNYALPWIDEVLVQNAYDFSIKMYSRTINNEFPWSPEKSDKLMDIPAEPKKKNYLSEYQKMNQSFSGSDMVCTIDITMPDGTKAVKVIGSLQTLTYSIHQDKRPVRAIGNMNAKDYVFGQRTIAGTLIFAVFNKHWAYEIMDEYRTAGELGSAHFLMDELPPFQITISAANEYGFAARLALYGVRVVNEGQVMSTNDVYTENTYQFVATDLDYLTACTGYKKPKAIRVPPIPPMTSTPLPAKPSVPAAPTIEASAELAPP